MPPIANSTATGKARFMPHALPELINAKVVMARGAVKPDLILADPALARPVQHHPVWPGRPLPRGVSACVEWCSSTGRTSAAWALSRVSRWTGVAVGGRRGAARFLGSAWWRMTCLRGRRRRILPGDQPTGAAGKLWRGTYTPTSKFVAIKVEKAKGGNRIAAVLAAD